MTPVDLVTLSKVVPLLLPVLAAGDADEMTGALSAHYEAVMTALALLSSQPAEWVEALEPAQKLALLAEVMDSNANNLIKMHELIEQRKAAHVG